MHLWISMQMFSVDMCATTFRCMYLHLQLRVQRKSSFWVRWQCTVLPFEELSNCFSKLLHFFLIQYILFLFFIYISNDFPFPWSPLPKHPVYSGCSRLSFTCPLFKAHFLQLFFSPLILLLHYHTFFLQMCLFPEEKMPAEQNPQTSCLFLIYVLSPWSYWGHFALSKHLWQRQGCAGRAQPFHDTFQTMTLSSKWDEVLVCLFVCL